MPTMGTVPRNVFYTLAEARAWVSAKQAHEPLSLKGWTLRHLDDASSGDPMKFATSVIGGAI